LEKRWPFIVESNKDEQLQAHWVRDGIEAEDIGQIITLPNF